MPSDDPNRRSGDDQDILRRIANLPPEKRAQLAARLLKGAHAPTAPAGIPRVARDQPIPVSYLQERLWFLNALEPESAAYALPFSVRLHGALRVDLLREAVEAMVNRHEALRTTFDDPGSGPVQIVHDSLRPIWEEVNATGSAPDERDDVVREHARRQFGRSFDLRAGPLVAAKLITFADDDHALIMVVHHIVADGWSLGILGREIARVYEALLGQRRSPLEPLPVQYADYAAWQRATVGASALEEHIAFWKEHLAGAPPAIDLQTDRPRARVATDRHGSVRARLGETTLERLAALCRAHKSTTFMAMLAAFAGVLGRITGQRDVVIAAPIMSRPHPSLESVVGFFMNTLPLRLDLSGNPTFDDLLERARSVHLAALPHQDVPFDRIVREVNPVRDSSRSPLAQVCLNVLNIPEIDLELANVRARGIPTLGTGTSAKFELELYVDQRGSEAELVLVYNADLFDEPRMLALLDRFVLLVEQAVENPSQPLARLSLVRECERAVLPDPAAPIDRPVQELIFDTVTGWAKRAPATVVFEQGDERWLYGDLARRIEAIAAAVSAVVERGSRVVVTGPRTPALVAALLGTMAAGAVVVPISASLPEQRKRMMAAEGKVAACLCVGGDAPDFGVPTIGLDRATGAVLDGARAAVPARQAGPFAAEDTPAYVFFTSGTTGTPKGILGQHAGLAHFLRWQRETFGIGPGDRFAQLMNLSFDPVLRDMLTGPCAGATLCFPPQEVEGIDPAALFAWLRSAGITVMHSVPSLLEWWLTTWRNEPPIENVRLLFIAGEPLSADLVRECRKVFPRCRVVNLYGPTETTMAKCFYEVPQDPKAGIQPVGRSMTFTQALVLNEAGALCAVDEVGEIVIRTPFRSLGYLRARDGELSPFRPNPFRDDPRDVLYWTGDCGRFLADGNLQILGRVDDQVKIHGVRVLPGEVAAVLRNHTAVATAFVAPFTGVDGRLSLCAYVVLDQGRSVGISELRAHAGNFLPSALVPTAFVFLDSLPLTPNGKVDRKALPKPDLSAAASEYVPPRTEIERHLARIWAEVLGTDRVGATDDFFALGGHSLLAMKLVGQLTREFHVDLGVRVVFEASTLAAMAERLATAQETGEQSPPPIGRAPRDAPLPLAVLENQWLERPRAITQLLYRVRGSIDGSALSRAVDALTTRHEILRTRFVVIDGSKKRIIDPPRSGTLETSKLTPTDVPAWSSQQAKRTFNFANEHSFRAALVELDHDEHILMLSIHHAVCDGWSRLVLWSDLWELYAAEHENRRPNLADLPIQYADYAVWQQERMTREGLEEVLSYWRQQLSNVPALALPTDRPRASAGKERGSSATRAARHRQELTAASSERLRQMGKRVGCSLYITLAAGFTAVLSRWSGQDRFALGTRVANRLRADVQGLVGLFANHVVLRADLVGAHAVRDVMERLRDQVVSVQEHEHGSLPFGRIIQELGVTPQVSFVLRMPDVTASMSGLVMEPLAETGDEAALFGELRVDCLERLDGGVDCNFVYAPELFDEGTIARMAMEFVGFVERMELESRLTTEVSSP